MDLIIAACFRKATVLQIAPGLIICLLFVTGCSPALWTVISAGNDTDMCSKDGHHLGDTEEFER